MSDRASAMSPVAVSPTLPPALSREGSGSSDVVRAMQWAEGGGGASSSAPVEKDVEAGHPSGSTAEGSREGKPRLDDLDPFAPSNSATAATTAAHTEHNRDGDRPPSPPPSETKPAPPVICATDASVAPTSAVLEKAASTTAGIAGAARDRSASGVWANLFGSLRAPTGSSHSAPASTVRPRPSLNENPGDQASTATAASPQPQRYRAPGSGASTPTGPASSEGGFSLSALASALKRPLNTPSPTSSVGTAVPTTGAKTSTPRAPAPYLSVPGSQQQPTPPHPRSSAEGSDKDASSPLRSPGFGMSDQDALPSVPPFDDSPGAKVEEEALPFDFNRFLEQMRQRGAEPVGKYLRSFLKEFQKRTVWNTGDQIRVINDFLDFISVKMREIPDGPWHPSVCPEWEFDNAVEAMEKLVMNRLWHFTFIPALPPHVPTSTDDLERDSVLSEKIRLFAWVREENLDLDLSRSGDNAAGGGGSEGFLEFAKQELVKINAYKAPRDKMICLLNCCKVIFGLIRHLNSSEGADTFIPVLILVVLKANPDHLVSNLQYIQRFRNPDKLQGESGYYLSSLSAAISFIERMDHSALSNISQAEFERNVEEAISAMPRSIHPSPAATQSAFPPGIPPHVAQAATSSSSSPLPPPVSRPRTPNFPMPGSSRADVEGPSDIQPDVSFPDATKAWFQRVPDLAERAVSKPLNAIARIVDDLAGEGEDQAQARPALAAALSPAAPDHRPGVVSPTRRRGERPWSMTLSPGAPPGARQQPPRRSTTDHRPPASPSFSPSAHPDAYLPDSADAAQLQEEIRRAERVQRARHEANIDTLRSIFPGLEAEVLEVVLVSHGGEMSQTIDALLEMN